MKTRLLTLVLIIFMSSCVHKIDYLNGDVEQIPVINCLFTADSTFSVYIGLTNEIFTNQNTIIENAIVKVVANNTDTIYFKRINDYLFMSDSIAKRDVNYKLIVETDIYGTLTAESSIPLTPVFDSAYIIFDNFYDTDLSYVCDQVFLSFFDASQNNDFYELSLLACEDYYSETDSLSLLRLAQDLNTNDFTDVNYDKFTNYPDFLLFNDKFWNNQTIIFSVNCNITADTGGDLVIIIKSLSKDYYLYKKSLLIQNNEISTSMNIDAFSNMLFVEKNTPIHTNINGGIGVFAGYNVDCKYIISDLQPPFYWK